MARRRGAIPICRHTLERLRADIDPPQRVRMRHRVCLYSHLNDIPDRTPGFSDAGKGEDPPCPHPPPPYFTLVPLKRSRRRGRLRLRWRRPKSPGRSTRRLSVQLGYGAARNQNPSEGTVVFASQGIGLVLATRRLKYPLFTSIYSLSMLHDRSDVPMPYLGHCICVPTNGRADDRRLW